LYGWERGSEGVPGDDLIPVSPPIRWQTTAATNIVYTPSKLTTSDNVPFEVLITSASLSLRI
jgi:hypothetical protein